MSDIGIRIKELRKQLGLSQQKFGDCLKVSKSHISNLESGADSPSDMLVKLICLVFEVNEAWLRCGTGDPKANMPRPDAPASVSPDSALDRLGPELRSRFDAGQFSPYGAILNESLENLASVIQNSSNVNKGILALSLKLFFDLLSSPKPDAELQKGFNEHIHETVTALHAYNIFLDDMLLADYSAEPFNREGYAMSLSKHRDKLLHEFWELYGLHAGNSKRYAGEFKSIPSGLQEPPVAAVKEGEAVYLPVFNVRMMDERRNKGAESGGRIPVPIVGDAAAGKPIEIFEFDQGSLLVDKKYSQHNVFAVRVRGDSMTGAGINSGDFVLVRPQPVIENGEIALVNIDGDVTIKYFYKQDEGFRLRSANPAYPPMHYASTDKLQIIGKVVNVIAANSAVGPAAVPE